MRKLKLILAVAFLTSFSGVAMADVPPEPSFQFAIKKISVGQNQSQPTRVIKLARLASRDGGTISLVSNDLVRYSLVSDDGVTVEMSTTTADGAVAGLVVSTIQTADGNSVNAKDDEGRRNWGWILVHGPGTAKVVAGGTNTHSAGDPFITSRDAGSVTSFEASILSQDATSAGIANVTRQLKATSGRGGFFMDASDGTSTTYDVFVMLE